MAQLEISLLGAFRVTKEGKHITRFETVPARALLIYLVFHPEMAFRREVLADLLWPTQLRSGALHALSQTLNRLRRAIESRESNFPFLKVTRQTIQFNPDSDYWLDTDAFANLADAVYKHSHRRLEACGICMKRLTRAADLYRGDLLLGFHLNSLPFQEWLTVERERLHRQAMETLYYLAECHNRRREYRQARQYAQRQLELEPWREKAHRQLMVALSLSGERSAALAQYEACRRSLMEELGVEPGAETETLKQRIRDGDLRASEVPPHNLPAQLTRFVGRRAELDQIAEQLNAPDCYLLTLVGPGGIGKTRLAQQAAKQALGAFAHGVYFVSLAGTSNPEFLVPTIGEAIGCPLSGEADPRRQLLNYLHQKEILLVLDSFEHLLSVPEGNDGGRDLLLEIVKTAPKLRLLVTSRERLELQAEWFLTLQGLPYPSEEATFEERAFEAVELFVHRAQRVRPGFTLSAEWPEVARICRLLEGMPLGIELAATWVSMMPCTEIIRELVCGLDLLSTNLHDVPARHRSLEAVFDHSWQLLSEPEQSVFKKLSVFRGGFDRQAARQVAGASLQTLTALVNKSLLRVVFPGRYDMLEPLKQYAAAKLAEMPAEIEQVQHRHCDYYAAFLHRLGNDLKGEKQRVSIDKIAIDIDNIRASWRWAIDQDNIEAIQLAQESLGSFYYMQGRMQEGRAAFSQAVAQFSVPDAFKDNAGGEASSRERIVLGYLLVNLGQFCVYLGFFEEGQIHLQQSVYLLRQAGVEARRKLAWALKYMGELCALQGRSIEIIQQYFEESLTVFTDIDDLWGRIETLAELGILAHERATSYAEAERYLWECVRLCQQVGERKVKAFAVNCLGRVAIDRGEYKQARQLTQEAIEIFQKLDFSMGIAYSRRDLGVLLTMIGAYDKARQRLLESLTISQEMGDRRNEAICLNKLGQVACLQAKYEQAEQLHQECLSILDEIGQQSYQFDCLIRLGRVAFDQGQYELAKQFYEEGLAGSRQLAFRQHIAIALNYLGQISCILDRSPHYDSRSYFHKALQISSSIQSTPVTLEILVGLAMYSGTHKSTDKARAAEILALAQCHPASSQDTKDRAAHFLTELEAECSPAIITAAVRRGQACDLQATVKTFLAELLV